MTYYVSDIVSYDLMAPIQFTGDQMWRDNWINFFQFFPGEINVTLEDLTVFQSGDLAAFRGLTRLQGTTASGKYIDMRSRETNVFRKIGGEWLIVHDHISVPLDFESGMALTDLKPVDHKI
jgi:ketosteroid isomerase-like protein